jgi:hypothetical protein
MPAAKPALDFVILERVAEVFGRLKLEREGELRTKLQDRFRLFDVGREHVPRNLERGLSLEHQQICDLLCELAAERVVAAVADF